MGTRRNEKEDSKGRLRGLAEAKLGSSFHVSPEMHNKTPEALIHELEVHQIELEMQNEELRNAQLALEESRNKYADLYDFAPVGYFTFTHKALISEVNLTGAALLRLPRQKLINAKFRRFVSPQDQGKWDRHLMSLLEQGGKQNCDLRLKAQDGSSFHARLDSIPVETVPGTFVVRTVISDITASKRAEDIIREREKELAPIYENPPLIMLLVDKEWKIRKTNAFPVHFAGRATADMINLRCGEAFHCIHSLDTPEGCGFGSFCRECTLRRTVTDTIETGHSYQKRGLKLSVSGLGKEIELTWLLSTTKLMVKGQPMALVSIQDITELKRAEEELRASEERYRSLVENTSDAILLLSTEREVISCNRAFIGLFGFGVDEVVGHSARVMHPSDESYHEFGAIAYPQIENSGVFRGEWNFATKDRRIIPCETAASAIRNDLGSVIGYVEILRDITKRRLMEEELRVSENKYRTLFEDSMEAISIVQDGLIIDVNAAWLGLHGFDSAGELIGTDILRVVHPRDKHILRRRRMMTPEKRERGYEIRDVRSDGETIYVEVYSNAISLGGRDAIITSVRDITERKDTERALLASYNKLEQAKLEWESSVDSLHELVFLLDIKGRILRSNRAVERWDLGNADEAPGQDLHLFLHKGCSESHCYLKAFLAGGLEALEGRGSVECQERDEVLQRYLSVKLRPFVSGHNHKARAAGNYAVATVSDITEHKEAEKTIREAYAELKEAQQELISSEKLALLGKFSSGIAHEIRNPLAIIRVSAQFCLNKYKVDEEVKTHLRVMVRNCDSADKIIKELIDLAKPSQALLTFGNVGDVIDRICELVKTRCEKQHVVLHKRWSKRLPLFLMDKERLEKAFLNFVLNGLDAMPKGGTLSINAYPDSQKQEVAISILDTGKGISQENLEKIFHPFFTTKRGGIGLGLCLAEQVISSHKGRLTIDSKVGQGTEVIMQLPVRKVREVSKAE